jgi:hypothetical protein
MVMLQRPGGAPPSEPADDSTRPPVAEVDGSEEVKKEIKEEIKREAVAGDEDAVESERQGNAKALNKDESAKGKEDVDPEEVKKRMPF